MCDREGSGGRVGERKKGCVTERRVVVGGCRERGCVEGGGGRVSDRKKVAGEDV